MRSRELFLDRTYTFFVSDVQEIRKGDIFFFSRDKDTDLKFLHIATVVGSVESGDPELVHAVAFRDKERPTMEIWPLSWFADASTGRYRYLRGIKRVK